MPAQPFRTRAGIPVTTVTTEQMRAVDRVAIEDLGFELLQMMENAGRTLATQVHAGGTMEMAEPVTVVAGDGGNGGGGMACARHLANHDVAVSVVLDRAPEDLTGAAATQAQILDRMGVSIGVGVEAFDERDAGTVVDALVGYGIDGALREPAAGLVREMNQRKRPSISLDVPSGMDATSGETLGAVVDADQVVTLALPKTGLVQWVGSLILADISIPPTVFDRLDIPYENPFGTEYWVELFHT